MFKTGFERKVFQNSSKIIYHRNVSNKLPLDQYNYFIA